MAAPPRASARSRGKRMKSAAKRVLPSAVWRMARELYLASRRMPEAREAARHPWRRSSIAQLGEWKDTCRGQRAFIIGNGPSLNRTDLSKLRHEYTFGLNRIFLMFPQLGFRTSFLVSVNDLVIEQSLADMAVLDM